MMNAYLKILSSLGQNIFVVASILFLLFSQVDAQKVDTISLKMNRNAIGLTTTITSDRDGFVWLGTLYGIQRYDGENFINIKELAPHLSLPKNFRLIHVDSNNDLWILYYEEGIYRIDLDSYEVFHYSDFNHLHYAGFTYGIFENEEGNIFFPQINEIVEYDQKADSLIHHSITAGDRRLRFTLITSGEHGVFYLSAFEGIFEYTLKDKRLKEIQLPETDRTTRNIIALDHQGHLWINTWYDNIYGLIKYHVKSEKIIEVFSTDENSNRYMGNTDIWDMSFVNDKLWVASNGGFWQIDIHSNKVSYVEMDDDFSFKNRINQMRSLHIDQNQNIWLGSNVNVYHSRQYEKGFKILKPSDQESNSLITSPAQTTTNIDNHTVAIGTINGISIYDSQNEMFNNFTLPNYNGNTYNNNITTIADYDDHSYWVGTWSGLYLIEDETNTILKNYITFRNAGNNHPADVIYHHVGAINHLCIDDESTVWFVNNFSQIGKLQQKESERDEFKIYKTENIKQEKFSQLLNTPQWGMIARSTNGLWKYDDALDSWVKLKTGNPKIDNTLIRGIVNAKNNVVFALTDSHLFSVSNDQGRDTIDILLAFPDDRLKSNPIVGMDDNVWFLIEDGIMKFDPITKTTIFFESDLYLDGLGFNTTSGYIAGSIDRFGNIHFAGDNGLAVIDTRKMNFNKSVPELRITGLESNGQKLSMLPTHNLNNLILDSDQDNLIITYTAINDHLPSQTTFKYLLNGINENWIDLAHQKSIALSGLAHGDYEFRLSATSSDGIESVHPLSLQFKLKPPFYKTKVAYLAYILSFLGITYTIYSWLFNQRLKREQLRTKISRDLHDEVGGILVGIALKSDMVQASKNKADEVQKIAQMSRSALSKMSDVLWSIDARRDNATDLIIKMKKYSTEMCNVAGIEHQFVAKGIKDRKLNHDIRQNIFLLFKESINNVIKHSEASHVDIKINNDQQFEMIIVDNGVGGLQKLNEGGQGMENLISRTKELRGTIDIVLENGCLIHLRCPKI